MPLKRFKHRKKPNRRTTAQLVTNLAATGHVEDQIALRLGVHKNELRARHIDDIKLGKQKAAASEAQIANLTRGEMHAIGAILSAVDSQWQTSEGNLLWPGLHSDCARDAVDAAARWLQDGSRFTCAGLVDHFSREQLEQIAEAKAAALALLKQNGERGRARAPIFED